MIFAGWACGCLYMGPIADKYGRKYVNLISNVFLALTQVALLYITRLDVYCFVCFLFGNAICGNYSIGYVWYIEMIPPSHQIVSGLFVDMSFPILQLIIGLYLQFVSKNYRWIVWFGIGSGFFFVVVNYFLLTESPSYLLEKGRRE